MTSRKRMIMVGGTVSLLVSGTMASGGAAAGTTITIADKGFTESFAVTQAYAQALQARGFKVTIKSLASTAVADAAIRKGSIQMYPDYTATLLTDVLKAKSVPTNIKGQVAAIKTGYKTRKATVLNAAAFNNDNEVACTKAAVDKYKLTTLSSLGAASANLVYSANPEHTVRPDGLPLLKSDYGVNFKEVIQVDIGLRYKPVEDGQAQCVYAFGTDPKISKDGLVVLTDDKGKFGGAPYQGIPVVSSAYLKTAPKSFTTIVNRVSALLTSQTIRDMNSRIELDKEDPKDVARDLLKSAGFVK